MLSTAAGTPVCLSVCWLAYLMLPVAMAHSFSDNNAIEYVMYFSRHIFMQHVDCVSIVQRFDSLKVR